MSNRIIIISVCLLFFGAVVYSGRKLLQKASDSYAFDMYQVGEEARLGGNIALARNCFKSALFNANNAEIKAIASLRLGVLGIQEGIFIGQKDNALALQKHIQGALDYTKNDVIKVMAYSLLAMEESLNGNIEAGQAAARKALECCEVANLNEEVFNVAGSALYNVCGALAKDKKYGEALALLDKVQPLLKSSQLKAKAKRDKSRWARRAA